MSAPLYIDIADAPSGGAAHWVNTPDGKRIRFAVWTSGARGTVLIFPGRTEYIEKYGRVVSELARRGFSALVIDWRGQGLSTRPNDTTDLGHVGNFSEYQTDLDAVLAHPATQDLPTPHVLLTHSMGGCIGLRALHRGLDVKAAIFSAPMWRIGLKTSVYAVARVMSAGYSLIGRGMTHATEIGPGHYVSDQGFEGNVLTNDPETYQWFRSHLKAHPELGLGGPSLGWAHAAFRETEALATLPAPHPILTFLGDEENIVSPKGVTRYMAKPGAGKLVTFPNAQHEIFMETGPVQARAWSEIDAWLADRL